MLIIDNDEEQKPCFFYRYSANLAYLPRNNALTIKLYYMKPSINSKTYSRKKIQRCSINKHVNKLYKLVYNIS